MHLFELLSMMTANGFAWKEFLNVYQHSVAGILEMSDCLCNMPWRTKNILLIAARE